MTCPPITDPGTVIVSGRKLEVRNSKKTKLNTRTDHRETAKSRDLYRSMREQEQKNFYFSI